MAFMNPDPESESGPGSMHVIAAVDKKIFTLYRDTKKRFYINTKALYGCSVVDLNRSWHAEGKGQGSLNIGPFVD